MALIPIEQLGAVGIVKDTPPYSLPPNAMSDGLNVRFVDNGVEKIHGYLEVMKDCPIYPQHIVFVSHNDIALPDYWIVFGNDIAVSRVIPTAPVKIKISCFNTNDGQWHDISPEPEVSIPEASVFGAEWNGRILYATYNGLQNWYWPLDEDGHFSHLMHFTKFEPLAPTGEVRNFNRIYAFKSHVIGLGVKSDEYESGDNPFMVTWSTPMGTYDVPNAEDWDVMNPDLDAGEYELNETKGVINGGGQIGDSFMVYKEDCIYVMNYIGPPFIFGFKVMAKDIGLLSPNGLDVFDGGHVFIGNNNVYLNNGQSVQPLLSDKLQTEMFDDMSGDNYFRSFVVADKLNTEMLIAWPAQDSRHCNRGILWNWRTGTMGLRELPDIDYACEGVVSLGQGIDWDNAVNDGPWDSRSDRWGERDYWTVLQELVFTGYKDKKLYRNGTGNMADTQIMTSMVERTGYDLGDPGSVKFVRAVWPKISTYGDNEVDVYVCSQMSPDDAISWEGPYKFNPNTQSKVSCRVTGKYFGVKVEAAGDFEWRLHGYEFDTEQSGRRGIRNYAV